MTIATRTIPAIFLGVLLMASGAPRLLAQAPPAAPAPQTSAPASDFDGIQFSGLIDGYYNYNANHPPQSDDGNQLRNFDFDANAFSLSMAKLTLARDPSPVGFRVDLGFGKAFTTILASEPNFKYLEQAYVSYKPAHAKGFEVDLGEFVTSAGAEVIEANQNWNYSRSLLFSLAIPYYHVGLRAAMPVTHDFTAGVQLVNGWNNFTDNNSGKTIGLTGAWTKPKFTLNTNYYVGPENNHTNKGFRNLFDGTLLFTPTPKLNAYINYDYGQNRNAVQTASGAYRASALSRWQGLALDLHYQATSKIAFSPRWEYYSDPNAFTTGLAQNLREFTCTGEYKIHEGVLSRIEYRRDDSDHDFFQRGIGTVPSQSTLEVALIAYFSPKR
ncbi:MAG: porin [Acidobacteriaceae bacterium]